MTMDDVTGVGGGGGGATGGGGGGGGATGRGRAPAVTVKLPGRAPPTPIPPIDAVPLGVVTVTPQVPVAAPAGTVAVTVVEDTTVNGAGSELQSSVTRVAPARLIPVMVTGVPTEPLPGLMDVIPG